MDKIFVEKRNLNLKEWKNRSAVESDYNKLITEPTKVYDRNTNELLIVYACDDLTTEENLTLEKGRFACQEIKYSTTYRTNGLKTTSKIFGYEPRKTLRKDFCSATSLSMDNPSLHNYILSCGEVVAKRYQATNPSLYEKHKSMTDEKVVEDYKIAGQPYTSGIINDNNPLKYHFDGGNYKNVWSGMITFKHEIAGGFLSCPEYNLGFALKDKSFLMFDGQGILHGVTPISMKGKQAKRYTVVYYSLQQMWNCLPLDEEIIRIRKLRTDREERRASKTAT